MQLSHLLLGLGITLSLALATPAADAALWEDATMATIGMTGGWSNKVELADINGDGRVDLLFANGRGYTGPEGPEVNYAFLNQGPGKAFKEVGITIFGEADASRVIKARDVDGDGDLDLFVGNTWGSQSRLYLGDGGGVFEEVTASHLPQIDANIGDAEFGDVDGDGDLDLVLADWGPGDPSSNGGGITRLWLNDGGGVFSEAAAAQMPQVAVAWSWELDLADVDNDYDLDLLISCKSCTGSLLFNNDSYGNYTDRSSEMPQFGNNYDFEAIDLNGDEFVDLITINDNNPGTREHLFIVDGKGGFVDKTADHWPDADNPAGDDNMVAFLDFDSDGDADFILAGLFGQPDRLLQNDGKGNLSLVADAFAPASSPGTLGIAVADLNGDRKLDVVMAEGEAGDPDYVLLGADIAVDSAAPVIDRIGVPDAISEGQAPTIYARVHDNKTPVADHDFSSVSLRYGPRELTNEMPMAWYGGQLWRAKLPPQTFGSSLVLQICATDSAGNETCSETMTVPIIPDETSDSDDSSDNSSGGESDSSASDSSNSSSSSETSSETNSETSSETSSATSDNGDDTTATGSGGAGNGDGASCSCTQTQGDDLPLGGLMLLLAFGRLVLRRRTPYKH